MADILQAAQDQINEAAQKLTSQTPTQDVKAQNNSSTPINPISPPQPIVSQQPIQNNNLDTQTSQVPLVPDLSIPKSNDNIINLDKNQNNQSTAYVPQVETINPNTINLTPVQNGQIDTVVSNTKNNGNFNKKSKAKGLIIGIVILLAVLIPAGVYFISNPNLLADIRGRAEVLCDPNIPTSTVGSCHQNSSDGCFYQCTSNGTWGSAMGPNCQGACGSTGSSSNSCDGGTTVNSTACNANFPTAVFTCQNPNGNAAAPTADGADPANMWARASCPSGQTCIGSTCQASGSGGSCAGAGEQCDSKSCCSGQNLVCQGNTGSRVCQQTGNAGSGDDFCKAGNGATGEARCNRFIGFKCSSPTNGQCLAGQPGFISTADHNTFEQAVSYAGQCGQADAACNSSSGDRSGTLCGDFLVNFSACPGNTEVTFQCQSLKILASDGTSDITNIIVTGTRKIAPGETLWMSTPAGSAFAARFRPSSDSQWTVSTSKTNSEFKAQVVMPNNLSANNKFEVELCNQAVGNDNTCSGGWK